MDVFGCIASVLGILGLGYSILQSQLPTTKIRQLDAMVEETRNILCNATESGLLPSIRFVEQAECDLFR